MLAGWVAFSSSTDSSNAAWSLRTMWPSNMSADSSTAFSTGDQTSLTCRAPLLASPSGPCVWCSTSTLPIGAIPDPMCSILSSGRSVAGAVAVGLGVDELAGLLGPRPPRIEEGQATPPGQAVRCRDLRQLRQGEPIGGDVERAVQLVDLGAHLREPGRGLAADPLQRVGIKLRVNRGLRLGEPRLPRVVDPALKGRVEVGPARVAGELAEQVGAERGKRVDLGLLDAHRRAPLVGALLRLLQR